MFEFDQDGSFSKDFETAFGTNPDGIAVDSEGDIYKVRGNGDTAKLNPSGDEINGEVDNESATGLAVDTSNDSVYVSHSDDVAHYDSAGNHTWQHQRQHKQRAGDRRRPLNRRPLCRPGQPHRVLRHIGQLRSIHRPGREPSRAPRASRSTPLATSTPPTQVTVTSLPSAR